MRASSRDRCRFAVVALSIALIFIAAPALALSAEYTVYENGTAYLAAVDLTETERYAFTEPGVLGERVPIRVSSVTLITDAGLPQSYNWTGASEITFPSGNYTVNFTGPLKDNHLVVLYDHIYQVRVILPEGYDVRNPLIGYVSPGANVSVRENQVVIAWNATRSIEARFYDPERESLLYLFGNFWVIIAVVLLMPFLLTMHRSRTKE